MDPPNAASKLKTVRKFPHCGTAQHGIMRQILVSRPHYRCGWVSWLITNYGDGESFRHEVLAWANHYPIAFPDSFVGRKDEEQWKAEHVHTACTGINTTPFLVTFASNIIPPCPFDRFAPVSSQLAYVASILKEKVPWARKRSRIRPLCQQLAMRPTTRRH